VYLDLDNSLLDAARAACVALPAAGVPAALRSLRGRGWALVAPLSIGVVTAAVALWSGGAQTLSWLALLLVPPGCALALGWAARGARPPLALLAVAALGVALAMPDDLAGQLARIVLIGGSCVTAGRLLAGAAPLPLVKAGVVVMAVTDAIVIFSGHFDHQNAQYASAVPAHALPQLQVADLGGASTGYGDFFVAGLVGGVFAAERRPQLAAAVATFVVSQAFDQLFLVVDSLPATVPPALVMVAMSVIPSEGRRVLRRVPRTHAWARRAGARR
jgi:hypothetical protein